MGVVTGPRRLRSVHQGRLRRRMRMVVGSFDAERVGEQGLGGEGGKVKESRDDDVLPGDLKESLEQAGASIALALRSGERRVLAELVVPELFGTLRGNVMARKGDQMRVWELCKGLVSEVTEQMGEGTNVLALLPDDGSAALVGREWEEDFGCVVDSVLDKSARQRAVQGEEDLIAVLVPDSVGVDRVRELAESLDECPTKQILLFNPQFVSSEVGVGLKARRFVRDFLDSFEQSYCLRPTGEDGAIFRRYPDDWKVFIGDEDRPGRFILLGSQLQRPTLDRIDEWIYTKLEAEGDTGDMVGFSIGRALNEFQRFVRTLSN